MSSSASIEAELKATQQKLKELKRKREETAAVAPAPDSLKIPKKAGAAPAADPQPKPKTKKPKVAAAAAAAPASQKESGKKQTVAAGDEDDADVSDREDEGPQLSVDEKLDALVRMLKTLRRKMLIPMRDDIKYIKAEFALAAERRSANAKKAAETRKQNKG